MIKENVALVIIDMINDFQFEYGPVLAKKAKTIAKNISILKDRVRQQGLPIIYVNDYYQLHQTDIKTVVNYCHNTLSDPIIKMLYPEKDDYFLFKPKHSAFYGTAFDILLRQLNVNTLILTGIAGNICVLFTANDAYMREYKLIVPTDCIASNNDHDNEYAIKMMKNVLQAKTPYSHKI